MILDFYEWCFGPGKVDNVSFRPDYNCRKEKDKGIKFTKEVFLINPWSFLYISRIYMYINIVYVIIYPFSNKLYTYVYCKH